MATIEKLIKAFEALKVFQSAVPTVEDVVKKKDAPINKKDKIMNCNLVADSICAPNMRTVSDFPKFLGIAMEMFMTMCDDAEADIRMVADECLNRLIKTLLETNLGRLQVELYKEIKKNSAARCLRAALWRFACMAHLIRPQKCRPYIVNLLPCLSRTCHRQDEGIQETLLLAMQKICPALMMFANDTEVKMLLKAFLPNLRSSMAACRRTAATSLTLICQHSRSPPSFLSFLLANLLEIVLPVDMDIDTACLVGVVLCIRNIVPLLAESNAQREGMKGSFGETKEQKEEAPSEQQILKVYQLLLHLTGHRDHNVVTATMEALQQLLRCPPPGFRTLLTTPGSVTETCIYQKDLAHLKPLTNSLSEVPSTSQLSLGTEDTRLDDETESCDIASQSASSDITGQSGVSDTSSSAFVADLVGSGDITNNDKESDIKIKRPASGNDFGVVFTANSEYSNIEIGDLQEDKSEQSNLSNVNSVSQETLLSIKSLSPTHKPVSRTEVTQDMNGNPEVVIMEDANEAQAVSPDLTETDIQASIGSMTEGLPIMYCVRLIARRFLLTAVKDELIPDSRVRVSVKTLALGCIASAVSHYPLAFLERLLVSECQEWQSIPCIRDVLQYTSHPDPQLKGSTAAIVGNFIASVLSAGRIDFAKWVKGNTPHTNDRLSLAGLMDTLLCVVEDSSAVAARLAISALRSCLTAVLLSRHTDAGLHALLKMLHIRGNSYWLVKVELLELMQGLDFRVIRYLETTQTLTKDGLDHYLGSLNIQEHFVEDIVLAYLADEDRRVRHSAAQTLVKLIDHLYYPVDHPHQDPVIAVAQGYTDHFLSPIMHDWSHTPPPLVQGLVEPYHVTMKAVIKSSIESSLSRIVMSLLNRIHISKSKYLTAGCCLALCQLSEVYLTSRYPHSWGCGVPTTLLPKEATSRYRRPPTRSLSASSTFSLDELTSGSGGGPLPMILSLLMSSPVTLDLLSHQAALKLAGNLIAGSAYRCLRSHDPDYSKAENQSADMGAWSSLSNRVLVHLIDQLLTHVARVLNAFAHVIDEQLPGPPQMKTSLPSLPNASSLSPIKRKNKTDKESASNQGTPTQETKSNAKQSQKDKEKEVERERNRKDGLGTFYTFPHYQKLFDALRGAYSNYKISLDLSSTDKFCSMLRTTLHVLSQILEVATLGDIGKYAEEFLNYLRTTVTLEPTDTVLCVQQLLKALFGTNLCSQWEEEVQAAVPCKPGKATRMSGGSQGGLYFSTFTQPYAQFTQTLAAATIKAVTPDHEDTSGVLTWLKKCVERKVPAILKPSSKADKTAIAAYIRLFEPLVIKALKQYTVTSSVELQQEVLDLLAQLVQLRVNYCLLDSDQVFIGFVIKQFEYIEEGQIRNSDTLIPHIFNFLVMLSYEKFHSKTIISMPKIIQLCDGIMASGLYPTTHAVPALQPIIQDLFLLRGASKTDISKELETQREVVVSMLLRLIHYYQALEMFVIVLQQCHRESEERWKRLSRQVADILLPALAKLQINLNSQIALDVVHRLFESVAPIVFRPVDILLKTLLMAPADITSSMNLERWMCLVLSVLRVLMAQTKEEVILSRINELGLRLHVFAVPEVEVSGVSRVKVDNLTPEEIVAWFVLQIIGKAVSVINQVALSAGSCDFLCQQLSHLLMYLTHMFQSGLFRRIATATMRIIHQEMPDCFHGIKEINDNFLLLGVSQPTLTLQWCNVLILLNFSDHGFWSDVVKTPRKYIMSMSRDEDAREEPQDASSSQQLCCNEEILRRGGLILFCDYACENLNDSEHMTWVLINHVRDLIELSQETPVLDFISAIHRNSAASSLFIQAIHSRWDDVTRPSVVRKTLKCLEAIHLSQGGALLTLLVDKFLNTHHLAVARACDTIACRRLEMLLADTHEERSEQFPLDDLDKLLVYMHTNTLTRRHARLTSLLCKFRECMAPEGTLPIPVEVANPLSQLPAPVRDLQIDKACYIGIVKEQCFSSSPNSRECAYLLQHLEYAEVLMITMTKEFQLSILEECMSLGAYRTLQQYNRDTEIPASDHSNVEWTLDTLFKASQLTLMRHINNVINMLPVPHLILTVHNMSSAGGRTIARYLEKMDEFFADYYDTVFQLAASLVQYLVSIVTFPWKPRVPTESQTDVCRFCTLCMECVSWMMFHRQLPTEDQLQTSLHCASLVLQSQQLATLIGQKDYVTWICSITGAVYQIVSSLAVLPGQQLCIHTRHDDQVAEQTQYTELQQLTRACDEISELVQYHQSLTSQRSDSAVCPLPQTIASLVGNITIGLSRVPMLNSFARTPPIVWKMGWIPTPSGEPRTKLPPLPVEFMLDKDVLREFVFRISAIGWISRQQFEETWMSLLGVLNPTASSPDQHISPEEETERAHCMVVTVRAITGMLSQTMLVPTPGNPARGSFDIQPRDKPLGFLHTRCGKKLTVIRGIVEQEVQQLSSCRYSNKVAGETLKYMFDNNLEREPGVDEYTLGQICIESIWSVVGVLDTNLSESDTTDSLESPSHVESTLLQNLANPPSDSAQELDGQPSSDGTLTRDQSLSGLDVHSCLQFLLELYRQWLIPANSSRPPLMLLNEVIKSVVSLSDLFEEREQFEWMLDVLFEVYKAHPGEDEIALQYLNVGICKAAAVVGVDNATADKLTKIIDNGLKSAHLPSRVASLYGILYLLEAGIPDISKLLVPLVTDFLLKHLIAVSQQVISSQRYMMTMWATTFYVMENYSSDLKDTDFCAQILQQAVSMASGNEDSISTPVYLAVTKGLERLLLTDVLSPQDSEIIIKLSVDRLCLPSPERSLAALGLLFTCMYSGKQYDEYSPMPREQQFFSSDESAALYQDPESLILAMERVTVLFDRIKKGYPYEARVIARVLPPFLADFFPAQDIMNKVIGEFLSSQQPYPQLIARVVFQVFSNLHDQRQHVLLKDWVMLSLSNFTQRTPVAMAMWSLTCFFISASTNIYLRNLLSYVLSRMGKIDVVDKKLFCLAAMDFYSQLSDDAQRRSFQLTFQSVSSTLPDSPYKDLLTCIT